jgi:glutamyl-Q tRNA(Asp) synthetase
MNAAAGSAYRGRFAPSPTGALHAGSLVAALASWLDARAHGGAWLIRIEDLDPPREVPGAARRILDDLARLGLASDEPVVHQSACSDRYDAALQHLTTLGLIYGCTCSRREIEEAIIARAGQAGVYPGTCRHPHARHGAAEGDARALRLRVPAEVIGFEDRAAGHFEQQLERDVGDFVLKRADGLWAYQIAVVVDDAAQGITDIVRGADLLDNTPRQIHLQRALGLPTPRYLHVPVVTNAAGEKLSKQTGALPIDVADAPGELERAWRHLGFARIGADSLAAFKARAIEQWRERWCKPSPLESAHPSK